MTLFKWGAFKSHSGIPLNWKIEANALTKGDIECLARIISRHAGEFNYVVGIPSGGVRLADELTKYQSPSSSDRKTILLVDDVLTTGASMQQEKKVLEGIARQHNTAYIILGYVIFARGKCPDWVTPMFQLNPELEAEK